MSDNTTTEGEVFSSTDSGGSTVELYRGPGDTLRIACDHNDGTPPVGVTVSQGVLDRLATAPREGGPGDPGGTTPFDHARNLARMIRRLDGGTMPQPLGRIADRVDALADRLAPSAGEGVAEDLSADPGERREREQQQWRDLAAGGDVAWTSPKHESHHWRRPDGRARCGRRLPSDVTSLPLAAVPAGERCSAQPCGYLWEAWAGLPRTDEGEVA